MSGWADGSGIAFRIYLETLGGAACTGLIPFVWLPGHCLLGGRRPLRHVDGGGHSRPFGLVAWKHAWWWCWHSGCVSEILKVTWTFWPLHPPPLFPDLVPPAEPASSWSLCFFLVPDSRISFWRQVASVSAKKGIRVDCLETLLDRLSWVSLFYDCVLEIIF